MMFFVHNNNLKIVFNLIVCFFISGCASNTPFSPAEKAAIHSVSVNPQVSMPPDITYYDRSQMGAYLGGGLIGYAIVHGAENTTRNTIKKEIEKQNIILNAMLKHSFTEKLGSTMRFTVVQNGFGDAQFKLALNSYGFGTASITSELAIPVLSAHAILMDSKGKILWQDTQTAVLDESPYNTYAIEYYLQNPLVMKQAFQTLTDELADNLVENLQTGN
jgi:hypothetical protein